MGVFQDRLFKIVDFNICKFFFALINYQEKINALSYFQSKDTYN